MAIDPYCGEAMIRRITTKKYRPAQCRALKEMGIPYITAKDGSPLVLLQNLPGHGTRDHHNGEPRFDEL